MRIDPFKMKGERGRKSLVHLPQSPFFPVSPFVAIVGMDQARTALSLLAIDPTLKGVLIGAGPGTAKSLLARAFPSILPGSDEHELPMSPLQESLLQERTWKKKSKGGRQKAKSKRKSDQRPVCPLPFDSLRHPCHRPFVQVPLNVTEDRLLGGLDLERTLRTGRPQFCPGLLAQAHKGVLYVDQVNLLDRSLAHHIAAALSSGLVILEREACSASLPADFMFIGTYDPDEGPVSADLADCVGLHVGSPETMPVTERVQLVTRALAWADSPEAFMVTVAPEIMELRARLAAARAHLPEVQISDRERQRLAQIAEHLGIEGHRADLFAVRTARAHAALHQRPLVREEDLQVALELVLLPRAASSIGSVISSQWPVITEPLTTDHRPPRSSDEGLEAKDINHGCTRMHAGGGTPNPKSEILNGFGFGISDLEFPPAGVTHSSTPPPSHSLSTLTVPPLDVPLGSLLGPCRQQESRIRPGRTRYGSKAGGLTVASGKGRYVGATATRLGASPIALDATLRAAAPFQKQRRLARRNPGKSEIPTPWGKIRNPKFQIRNVSDFGFRIRNFPPPGVVVTADDLRWKRLVRKAGRLIIFLLDASGSMARHRMNQAKGAVIRLLRHAYRRRDKVALITFRGHHARLLLGPSRSVELARRALDEQAVGGGTPLAAGLLTALDLIKHIPPHDARQIMLVILTDGRANVSYLQRDSSDRTLVWEELSLICAALRRHQVTSLVIDTNTRFTSDGRTQALAELLGGQHIQLPYPDATTVYMAVTASMGRTPVSDHRPLTTDH